MRCSDCPFCRETITEARGSVAKNSFVGLASSALLEVVGLRRADGQELALAHALRYCLQGKQPMLNHSSAIFAFQPLGVRPCAAGLTSRQAGAAKHFKWSPGTQSVLCADGFGCMLS